MVNNLVMSQKERDHLIVIKQVVKGRLSAREAALRWMRHRVAQGGHDVPKEVVRRRYDLGMANLHSGYVPLADVWYVFDNSGSEWVLAAERQMDSEPVVHLGPVWKKLWEGA